MDRTHFSVYPELIDQIQVSVHDVDRRPDKES